MIEVMTLKRCMKLADNIGSEWADNCAGGLFPHYALSAMICSPSTVPTATREAVEGWT